MEGWRFEGNVVVKIKKWKKSFFFFGGGKIYAWRLEHVSVEVRKYTCGDERNIRKEI